MTYRLRLGGALVPLFFFGLCALGCGGSSATGASGGATASSSAAQHNVDALNEYRARAGAPPLARSDKLDQFATTGSDQLAAGGEPHGHFGSSDVFASGFCSGAGENQAPGWPVNGDENGTIDHVLEAMMGEGPGGGHHDNIVNPHFATVGIGLIIKDGSLYLTNDFSNACQ
jgi:uncharacterized protein YkwD